MGDNITYVTIPFPDDKDARDVFGALIVQGTRVRQVYGLSVGRKGSIAGYARGKHADSQFRENQSNAILAGRDLTNDDYDPLIDAEGPLVKWDGENQLDWFPGQAMVCIEVDEDAERDRRREESIR